MSKQILDTSTDLLDTDEARQTNFLILQQAPAMAAQGGEMKLLSFLLLKLQQQWLI